MCHWLRMPTDFATSRRGAEAGQVERLGEMHAELVGLGPAHGADHRADADDVDRQDCAGRDRLFAFDQRAHRRHVAQADFGRRPSIAAIARRIRRWRGSRTQLKPSASTVAALAIARAFRPARLAENIALDLADAELADQWSSSWVSTPSAVVSMPRLSARVTMARMIAALRLPDGGAAHEALVDLDLVERRLLQIAERGIAGAEIVEREPHADRLQPGEHLVGRVIVGEEHAFGDLQLELRAAGRRLRRWRARRSSADSGSTNWIGDRLTAMRTLLGPFGRFEAGGAQHPFADLRIRPASSASGMNMSGEIDPRVGWCQRTSASKPEISSLRALTIGWYCELQLAARDRLAQVGLEHLPVLRPRCASRARRSSSCRARRPWRRRARGRRCGPARRRSSPRVGAMRDPDRRADRDVMALDHVRHARPAGSAPGEASSKAGRRRLPGSTALNSSPPSRPTWPSSPITLVSRCATCLQQRVADRVAERVVDVLEPVEVDQEQGAAASADARRCAAPRRASGASACGWAGRSANHIRRGG